MKKTKKLNFNDWSKYIHDECRKSSRQVGFNTLLK